MQTDSDIHHNKSVPLKIGRRVAACGAAKRRRKPQRVPKPVAINGTKSKENQKLFNIKRNTVTI